MVYDPDAERWGNYVPTVLGERYDAFLHLEDTSPLQPLHGDASLVPIDWVAYQLTPWSVEFWQAEREREQVRLRYLREHAGWVKDLLWP